MGLIVRLLADREPYASYANEGDPKGFLFFIPLSATPGRVASADIAVLPAASFLALPARDRPAEPIFAYGPVSLIAAAFAAGCYDYLRDPWSLAELRARAERFDRLRFLARGRSFELKGSLLSILGDAAPPLALSEVERKILRLLLRNAREVVTRSAIAMELWREERHNSRAIDVYMTRLRARLESLDSGSGILIMSCRGQGYRFDVNVCG